MRLHSVHPIGFFSRQSRAYIEIYMGVRFFMPFFSQNLDTLQSFGSKEKYTPLMYFALMLEIQ